MSSEVFRGFNLVGGTSLALQIGHRFSIDIDMFGNSEVDEYEFIEELSKFGKPTILKKSKNIIIVSIDGIKVDFVNYKYPLLEDIKTIENIRLVSDKDIAAMKLNAIAGRGSRKDFIDLYFLLKKYSLTEMLDFYKQKYIDGSEFMVIKSLNYFEDADSEEMPIMFEKISWNEIKTEISRLAKNLI
ncbi:nucleotidyl transferase AbiEii/AbiGii toxin family protein [Flavobacterium solisilvae]|nr:nucleotidyl transferase AbiEii/AbiGii toxin family protein [Flavobacterium solisilvae]